ncbi:alpha/beta hydrolase [Bacillaceae bacterium SIJ1]|nr:alpha/beta hydrolase [Litoribacterium kuwaitense]
MKYIYHPPKTEKAPVLLLLHGTGGSEQDLIELGRELHPDAGRLSVRGQEIENGMPRYFKRLAPGVFDLDNLTMRTEELYQFIQTAREEHAFQTNPLIAVGYSNGANIAGSLMYDFPEALAGAVLFHPMVPRRDKQPTHLSGKDVWIGAGTNDPMCPAEETKDLTSYLQQAGAEVDVFWTNQGHQLSMAEVEAAKNWLSGRSF